MKNTNILIPPSRILRRANLFLFFLLLFLPSCKEEPVTPKPEINLLLRVEDVSCTEAWLKLTTTNLQLPSSLDLLKNDNIIKTINLEKSDTLLYIDSLLPNQTYNFQISGIGNPASGIKSNVASATTLDTTSHNFTWETFEFGTIGSSMLNDVTIIDENNIWAVGDIKIADTSVNGCTIYNAAHWDGNEWTLHRIMFYTICGQLDRSSYPINAIFAFNENEIWVGSDGRQIARINGTTQVETICPPFSMVIKKIWGTSSTDLYMVGINGAIAHYNGSQWIKIESGTTQNFYDIYGAKRLNSNQIEIIATSSLNLPTRSALFRIENKYITQISSEPIRWELVSSWFVPDRHYYTAGAGIYEKHSLSDTLWKNEPLDITHYSISDIRGTALNNVFATGSFGESIHFNGYTWKSYRNETALVNGNYLGLDTKNDLIVVVGYDSDKAIITVGDRIN